MKRDITIEDFEINSTASRLNLPDIEENSALHILINKLNCSTSYDIKQPNRSIMNFGEICNHDDSFLCEHRLQFIVGFIKENFNEK